MLGEVGQITRSSTPAHHDGVRTIASETQRLGLTPGGGGPLAEALTTGFRGNAGAGGTQDRPEREREREKEREVDEIFVPCSTRWWTEKTRAPGDLILTSRNCHARIPLTRGHALHTSTSREQCY